VTRNYKKMENHSATCRPSDFYTAMFAGACAGLAVDISLFPLDTIKTRLQSEQGFLKAGGFRGIYSGLSSAAVGSAPNAAIFFVSYEFAKHKLETRLPSSPVVHMTAASFGEVMACVVRVPMEVIKQRAQSNRHHLTSLSVLKQTLRQDGFLGLYRGYFTTIFREIPFSFIQFPLWEYLKQKWSKHQGHEVQPWQSSICGAFSGGVAASVTTPLDVAKTRVMLAESGSALAKGHMIYALRCIWIERGVKGLFAGVAPRTMWISIGGAVFLGAYDKVKQLLNTCRA
jgi:solute carrier family 25 S-adenosylmethionine transporter 26